MSQFTEADSAVNRLSAAVTAFEKVLTEPEGTVVEMPVGAVQPSLAERLKRAIDAVTVKPAQAAAQATAAAQQAQTAQQAAAQSATDAANSAAATGYVDAPFPDVWAPLSDDLRLLAGFAPPDKSMTFTRSTTARYIDKSGVLKTAAINEPRFEREGLLIEGQSTNYVLNSDDPTQWQSNSTLTKASIVDGTTQAITYTGTVNAATSANHQATVSSNISVNAGDTVTISARAKASSDIVRFRFTLDGTDIANIFFNAITGEFISATAGLTYTTALGSDGYAYLTATYTAPSAGVVSAGVWLRGNANLTVGTVIYIQMLQVEKNPVATSYIPTGSSAVTRAGDFLEISPLGNVGYRLVGDSFARSLAFEITVNRFVNPTVGYVDVLANWGAKNDIILRFTGNTARAYRSSSGPTISNVTFPLSSKIYAQTIDTYNNNEVANYFDGKSSSTMSGGPVDPSSAGTALRFQGNSNIVHHIRNFRIWHRLLTPIQIKGLR